MFESPAFAATGAAAPSGTAAFMVNIFPLILIFCQRWQKDFGLGSLAATMLPYSIGLLVAGLALTIGWVVLDLPLGPGASVFIDPPTTVAPTAPATAVP